MIAPVVVAPAPAARRIAVPVWLTLPATADIGAVSDEDLVAELRRRGYAAFPLGVELEVRGLRVPPRGGTVVWDGRAVGVTDREADVLRVLAAAWPRPVPSARLAAAIWGDTDAQPHARLYVRYLRKKLGRASILCETKGGGYRLALEENGHA